MKTSWSDSFFSIALRTLNRTIGYQTKIADTEEARLAACALRRKIYWNDLHSSNHNEPLEQLDRYDQASSIMTAFHKDQLIGTVRLMDRSQCSLIEDIVEIDLPPSLQSVDLFEFSGLAIHPDHRGEGRFALIGLLELAYRHSLEQQRSQWLCLFHNKRFRAFTSVFPDLQELPIRLRPEVQAPAYISQRVVPRLDEYKCFLVDLRRASYTKNILGMLRSMKQRKRSVRQTLRESS